jgi:tetratricopeptide (TPR) repeat protein
MGRPLLLIFLLISWLGSYSQNKDSLLSLLKTKNLADSSRCKTLEAMMVADPQNYYKWNQELFDLAGRALKEARSKKEKDLFTEWFADATFNIGVHYSEKGDTGNAILWVRKSMPLYLSNGNVTEYYEALHALGVVYESKEMYDRSVPYFLAELKDPNVTKNSKFLTNTYNSLGMNYSGTGDYVNTLHYYKLSLAEAEKINDTSAIGRAYSNLGKTYEELGDMQKALEYKLKSLAILEKRGESTALAVVLNNIGLFYSGQDDFERALSYYNKAYDIYVHRKDTNGLGLYFANAGAIYVDVADTIQHDPAYQDSMYRKGLDYSLKALYFRRKASYPSSIATTLNNIGRIHASLLNYEEAFKYYQEAYEIRKKINDRHGLAGTLNCMADVLYRSSDDLVVLRRSEDYALQSLALAREMELPWDISTAARTLYYIYQWEKKYKQALEMYELYDRQQEIVKNQKTRQDAKNQQFKYEWEKREGELKSEQDKKDAITVEEKKRQRFVIYSVVFVLLFVLVVSVLLFRRFKVAQKQKRIIELKEEETRRQKHLVEEKQKEILDSIRYAQRIQSALLPNENYLNKNLGKYLTLIILFAVFFSFSQNKDSLIAVFNKKDLADSIRCRVANQLMEADPVNVIKWNDELLRTSDAALAKAKSQKEKNIYTDFLAQGIHNKGAFYFQAGDSAGALSRFRKALGMFSTTGNTTEIIYLLQDMATVYRTYASFSMAIKVYEQLKNIQSQQKDEAGVLNSLNIMGICAGDMADYKQAMSYHEQSLELAEKLKDTSNVGRAYSQLGLAYYNLSDIPRSIEYQLKALSIFEKRKDKLGELAYVQQNLAGLYTSQKNLAKAMTYLKLAEENFKTINYPIGLADVDFNIGSLLVFVADSSEKTPQHTKDSLYKASIEYNKRSLGFYSSERKLNEVAVILRNIGATYNKLRDFKNAYDYLSKGLELSEKINDRPELAAHLFLLAEVIHRAEGQVPGDIQLAKKYGERSIQIAKELKRPVELVSAALVLCNIYKDLKNYQGALEMYKLYDEMKEVLENEANHKAMKSQEFKYEWEKREGELKAAQEKKDVISREEKKRQLFVIYGVVFILFVVLVFSVLLFRRFRLTQKQKRIIELKEEETRQQKHLVEEKQREILDSITYARRIQRALITNENYIAKEMKKLTKGLS